MAAALNALYLSTEHVLAAVSAGAGAPTVEELVGGALRVHSSDREVFVDVPARLLKAKQVAVEDDALDRPYRWRIKDGDTPLQPGDDLVEALPNPLVFALNAEYVIVTQTADDSEVSTGTTDAAGSIPLPNLPGAAARIVACKGHALIVEKLP